MCFEYVKRLKNIRWMSFERVKNVKNIWWMCFDCVKNVKNICWMCFKCVINISVYMFDLKNRILLINLSLLLQKYSSFFFFTLSSRKTYNMWGKWLQNYYFLGWSFQDRFNELSSVPVYAPSSNFSTWLRQ